MKEENVLKADDIYTFKGKILIGCEEKCLRVKTDL